MLRWARASRALVAFAGLGISRVHCEAQVPRESEDPHRQSEWRQSSFVRCRGDKQAFEADYEVVRALGSGGFGSITLAQQRSTGLLRVVKTVPASDARAKQLQMGEVAALIELEHPNIVHLYEYYQDAEGLYLVQEYCAGGTLEERLEARGGRLDGDEAAIVLRQMLRAILCCHANGLFHRDLKPDNFVFESEGRTARLVLIDFGLSTSQQYLEAGTVQAAGSIERSAPETLPQRDAKGDLLKSARYSQASDMWSIGAILYRLFAGELLLDLEEHQYQTESEEFNNLAMACMGQERDILDNAASKVRSATFVRSRLRRAYWYAPRNGLHLLEQLLEIEPDKRITAAQALKHDFICESYRKVPRSNSALANNVVEKLRRYSELPALCRLALRVEAHLLGPSDNETENLGYLAFHECDKHGAGVLSTQNVAEALIEQGLEVPEDLKEICYRMDSNGDGVVTLSEFVAATMESRLFSQPCLVATTFRLLDADGDGFITLSDLQAFLSDSTQCRQQSVAALESAGLDEHGQIDFHMFGALIEAVSKHAPEASQ